MSLRNFITRFLSLAAGEAAAGPDLSKIPHTGKAGEVTDGGSFIAPTDDDDSSQGSNDEDGGNEEEDQSGKAPSDAGRTRKGPKNESEESDDNKSASEEDGEDDGGESEGGDTTTEGEGADDDDGVDPAVGLSIRRNWESRFDGAKDRKAPDPLAMLKAHKVTISDETRARAKELFEKEDDVGAIAAVLSDLAPQLFGAYDGSRVAPVLTEQQTVARNVKIVRDVADFDQQYPGARTKKITDGMAALYDEFKEKYGYQFADEIPVQDYFYMAGGRVKRANAAPKPAGKSKSEQVEAGKEAALAAVRQPERIGKPKGVGGNAKPTKRQVEEREVSDLVEHISKTHFDPFVIR